MKKILFVCLGNICRSPMAEFLLRSLAAQRGMEVQVSSAGTSGWHDGEFMHCGTAEILDSLHIDTKGFASRQIKFDDLARYDYLIAMDDSNVHDLHQMFGESEKIFKITDLIPDSGFDHIPDPWYTGHFQQTSDLLTAACEALLDKLQANQL